MSKKNLISLTTTLVVTFILLALGQSSNVPLAQAQSFSCSSVTEIPVAECNELVNLYNSTNGANWSNKIGWLSTNTPCSWFGASCSGSVGHITSLDLKYNLLSGTIPNFTNLPNLFYLNLYNNQLNGTIPNFNLPNLVSLDIQYNQLTGSIPNFSNMPNLRTLELESNQLTGNIPNFSNLPNLTWLDLSSNQLTGSIPNFSNLPNLKDLLLRYNKLTGNIPNFSNLPNLEDMWLLSNQLEGQIPNFNLPYLWDIEVSYNRLSGTIPNITLPANIDFRYNCGLVAYDAAQATILNSKDTDWKERNFACRIQVNPTSLTFNGMVESANPVVQAITITDGGFNNLAWLASVDQSWLSLSSTSGTAPSTVNVFVNTSGLSAGTYNGTVSLGSSNGGSQAVYVTLNVKAQPVLQVNAVLPIGSCINIMLSQHTPGLHFLQFGPWTVPVANSANNLFLVDSNGQATQEYCIPLGVPAGTYEIKSFREGNNPMTDLPQAVILYTAYLPPALQLSSSSLNFSGVQGGSNPANQAFTVSNSGSGTLSWSISPNQSWLSVSPTTGTNAGTVNVSVNTINLSAGTHNGSIAISSNGGNQTINVTLYLDSPTPNTPTSTPTNTPTNTPTGTQIPTFTPTKTSTSTPTGTPTPTNTPTNNPIATTPVPTGTTPPPPTTPAATTPAPTTPASTPTPGNTISISKMDLTVIQGSGNNAVTQPLTITHNGTGTLNWNATVTSTNNWLSLDKTSGIAPSTLIVKADARQLNPGRYKGYITIDSNIVRNRNSEINANQTTNSTTITVTLTVDCQDSKNVDVMLLLDRSGSMAPPYTNNQTFPDLQQAASNFVDLMDLTHDQVGIIYFNSTAVLEESLSSNGTIIKQAIYGISSPSGGTDIIEALRIAENELASSRHNPNNQKVIVLFSDGKQDDNTSRDPVVEANIAKNAGIRIVTVGLGEVDEQAMNEIATSSTDYYYAPISSKLADIYDSLSVAVGCQANSYNVSGKVVDKRNNPMPGVRVGIEVFLPETKELVTKEATSNDLGEFAVSGLPAGQARTYAVKDGYIFTYPSNFDDFALSNNITNLIFTGVPIPTNNLGLEILTPSALALAHLGDEVLVKAKLTKNGQPLIGKTVFGDVQSPEFISFNMYDTGINGDTQANDGIYTGYLPIAYPLITNTTYKLHVESIITANEFINSSVSLKIIERAADAPTLTSSLQCPNSPNVYKNDTCTLTLQATFADGQLHGSDSETLVSLIKPDGKQETITLMSQSNNQWQTTLTFADWGSYIFDIRLKSLNSSYSVGYFALTQDVYRSRSKLELQPLNLPTTFYGLSTTGVNVKVLLDGQPVDDAMVYSQVADEYYSLALNRSVQFNHVGYGQYEGVYLMLVPNGKGTLAITATASYMPDPIFLTHNFTVGGLKTVALEISDFTDGAVKDLAEIDKNAKQVAKDGDLFWKSTTNDNPVNKLFSDLAFDLVVTKFFFTDKVKEQFKGLVFSKVPGSKFIKASWNSTDGRIWKQWATRFQNSVSKCFYINNCDYKYIGKGVMRRAVTYYASEFLNESMDSLVEDKAKDKLLETVKNKKDILSSMYSDSLSPKISTDKQQIQERSQLIQNTLDYLNENERNNLVINLAKRREANHFLGYTYVKESFVPLYEAAEKKRDEDKLSNKIINTLMTVARDLALTYLTDGWAIILEYEFNTIEYLASYKEDITMSKMAFMGFNNIIDDSVEKIVFNTNTGLDSIVLGTNLPTPNGKIENIAHRKFVKTSFRVDIAWAYVTDLTIKNTGSVTATYQIYERFTGKETEYKRIEEKLWHYVGDNNCQELTENCFSLIGNFVELAPQESKQVFLHPAETPKDGKNISYILIANDETGTYLVDFQHKEYHPKRQTFGRSRQSTATGIAGLTEIPNPIQVSASNLSYSNEYVISIYVQNPFPFSIIANVSQPIPSQMQVTNPYSGTLANNQLQWYRVIPPRDMYVFNYKATLSGSPTDQVTVPSATLSFNVPEYKEPLVFDYALLTLSPRVPLIATGNLPQVISQFPVTVPVTLQNFVNTSATGEIKLIVSDVAGNELARIAKTVTLSGQSQQDFTLSIPNDLSKQEYLVLVGSVNYEGTETEFAYRTAVVSMSKSQQIYLPVIVKK